MRAIRILAPFVLVAVLGACQPAPVVTPSPVVTPAPVVTPTPAPSVDPSATPVPGAPDGVEMTFRSGVVRTDRGSALVTPKENERFVSVIVKVEAKGDPLPGASFELELDGTRYPALPQPAEQPAFTSDGEGLAFGWISFLVPVESGDSGVLHLLYGDGEADAVPATWSE